MKLHLLAIVLAKHEYKRGKIFNLQRRSCGCRIVAEFQVI
jgi:hypothetical protein